MKRNGEAYRKGQVVFLGSGGGGFTLVEVLIAMFILLVGLLAVASMQISAMQGNSRAMEASEKTAIAQNVVDELMALPYDDPATDPYVWDEGTHDAADYDGFDVPEGIASITWVVDEDPADGWADTDEEHVSSVKRVTVTVTPEPSFMGGSAEVSVTTVKPLAQDN